jgi:hypothetical protein
VLAFGFTEKHHFMVKTDRNSVFLGREPHISDRLHIIALYIIFYGFEKKMAQNPKELAFGFTEKCLFVMKIGQKFIFYPCESHILSWLVVSVLYINF